MILNIPVTEETTSGKYYTSIKECINASTKYENFYSLTTDGLLEYKDISDELGVAHQLCISHNYFVMSLQIFDLQFSLAENDKSQHNDYKDYSINSNRSREYYRNLSK